MRSVIIFSSFILASAINSKYRFENDSVVTFVTIFFCCAIIMVIVDFFKKD